MIDNVVVDLKSDEGFEGMPYEDSRGNMTIGYGTKLPLTKNEATVLLRMRTIQKHEELSMRKPLYRQLPQQAREVLLNMAYQLGVSGLLGFKKMWEALQKRDFSEAADEMIDSEWYRQTPNRVERLANIMRGVS